MSKLKANSIHSDPASPSDTQFKLKFWGTCNDWFNRVQNILLRFSMELCMQYLQDTLTRISNSSYFIPSRFIKLHQPSHRLDTSAPTCCEVARAINKAKN